MIGRAVTGVARGAVRVARTSPRFHAGVATAASTRLYNTLGELVQARATAHPRREVLKVPHQDVAWDAAELNSQTDAVAAGLLEAGYTRDSTLALWLANETEHLVTVIAAAKIGMRVIVIDPHVSIDGVATVIKAEECRGLMFGQRFKSEARTKLVAALTDLEFWHWGDNVNDKSMRKLRHLINTGHEEVRGILQFGSLPVYNPMPDPIPILRPTLSADDVLVVPYSAAADGSAVRGEPLTQGALVSTAKASAKAMNLSGEDIVCVSAWLHSRFGLAAGSLAALHAGSKILIPSREENAQSALECVDKFQATALVGRAVSLSDTSVSAFNLSSLRTGLLGGAGAPPELTGVTAVDEAAVQAGKALA